MTLRVHPVLAMLTVWAAVPAAGDASAASGIEALRDRAAFTADPGEVLAVARALPLPAGAAVDVLYQEVTLTFDGDSRVTWRRHWFYRVARRAALEDWSRSEARWAPGYQERPAIRARVLTPAVSPGEAPGVQVLDPDAVRFPEAGAGGQPVAWAPLPGIRAGAVVEEEVVIRDRRPFSAAGVSGREMLVLPAPIHHGRVHLDAPIGLPLRYGVRLATLEPEREIAGGRVRLMFDYRDMPAAEPPPAGLPGDRPRFPHVAYSTGDGWPEVAAELSRQLDAAIAGGDPRILRLELGARSAAPGPAPADGSADAAAQTERIAGVLRALRSRVKPSPRALSAGLVFASPEAILDRDPGGSREAGPLTAGAVDRAVLLVAALRAESIPAYLALLRAGFDQDVEAGLPGTGLFNHALAYVPAGRPLWIDPSDAFLRAGELASECQDRRALVVSPTTRDLTRTPAARSQDNLTVSRVDVYLAEEGPARFVESTEYHGQAERNQRRLAASLDPAGRRLGYRDYVRSAYRSEKLGEVEESFAKDLSSGYRLKLEALDAGRAFTGADEAAVAIDLRPLLGALPQDFLVRSRGPRQDDFVFHEPFVTDWHYRIFADEKLVPRPLPVDASRPLGTGSLTRGFRIDAGMVYAHFRLDSGPRRLSARQFDAFREAVQELYAEDTLVLWFDRVGKRRKNR